MKTLLVTGITGKSGGYFLRELANHKEGLVRQYKIRIALRSTSDVKDLEASGVQYESFIGDLRDEEFLKVVTQSVDVILHIAGISFSEKLARAAVGAKTKWIILVHTTGIYSKFKKAGTGYREIEQTIIKVTAETNTVTTILRPTMIYGSLDDHNISVFIRFVDKLAILPIINGGHYDLQPVHANDLGVAYYQVLSTPITQGRQYVLSGGTKLSLRNLLSEIATNLGVQRKFLFVPFFVAFLGSWVVLLLSFGRVDLREKVQRLCESRAYSHDDATRDFSYCPMPFSQGIAEECDDFRNVPSAEKVKVV